LPVLSVVTVLWEVLSSVLKRTACGIVSYIAACVVILVVCVILLDFARCAIGMIQSSAAHWAVQAVNIPSQPQSWPHPHVPAPLDLRTGSGNPRHPRYPVPSV
jgi:hypothetical protein